MANGIPKRIVVIKDIPSNFIEEAIFILKNDPASNTENSKDPLKRKKVQEDYLLKEAESIVNSYIKDNKVEVVPGRNTKAKFDAIKNRGRINTFINIGLIGSIALLIFIITRIL